MRQVLLDDFPDNLYVDVEIIVNDAISQADDFAPLDLRVLGREILRQAVSGFADDFQIAHDGVDGLIVFYENSSGFRVAHRGGAEGAESEN